MADYEAADYYDANDYSESLTCTSPEAALKDVIEALVDGPGADYAALITEHGPFPVQAYARRAIPDNELVAIASHLSESFAEHIDDEYGDPDGGSCFPDSVLADWEQKVVPLLRQALEQAHIWACEKCGKRTYSAQEVDVMMRAYCPEWFA